MLILLSLFVFSTLLSPLLANPVQPSRLGVRLPIKDRLNAQMPDASKQPNADFIPLCNLTFANWERDAVLVKYADAPEFLAGINLFSVDFNDILSTVSNPLDYAVPFIDIRKRGFIDVPVMTSAFPVMSLTDFISGNLDMLYYGPVKIGTPEQQLTVDVDTGSADLWIPSNCPSCVNDQFDHEASSTFQTDNQRFAISYGTGSARGIVGRDTVHIAGMSVTNQSFGAVDRLTADFNEYPNDGLLGMAFGTISRTRAETVFENLMRQGQIQDPMFSIHLGRMREQGSELCLGCSDPTKMAGTIAWVPVQSKTYWTVPMDAFSANGEKTLLAVNNILAAIDTGTSLIYFPGFLAETFYNSIPGSRQAEEIGRGIYAYPCDQTPSVALSFGGFEFAIHPDDFNLGKVSTNSSECVGGVVSSGNGGPQNLAIIGVVFLKSWYTVYDYAHGTRIGFAPSINNAHP
ncbi:acid protease [Cylindrobasidium torrendii FP15055 ss-10]|uniref:Acid protease n=1 Tax=Cylindrobasidium torrendii FP15055 ss-10 TaxID=1314674 RepID=A0A0D7BXJ7_9AGAR|nr:acid protease [Cylindrobasidium torrendii FP15055 ss-10]